MYVIDHWAAMQPPPSLPADGELHLWRIDLDASNQDLIRTLSGDERERAESLLRSRDRHRFVLARGAMRTILGHYLDIPPEDIRFRYGEQGKPFLEPSKTELAFNLTHSGEMALLALTAGGSIGIDLELCRERKNMLQIARRLFDQSAWKELETLRGEALGDRFLQHWTALEAQLKALGKGIFAERDKRLPPPLEIHHFTPRKDWIAAVATTQPVGHPVEWHPFQFPPG